MCKVVGVITARMGSTRSPGKVMRLLKGKSVFEHHIERMSMVSGLATIYLATSTDAQNDILVSEATRLGVKYFRGAEEDIVSRHIGICEAEAADAVIRVTCDMPLFDIDSASRYVAAFYKGRYDYIYINNMTIIQGTVPELISHKALKRIHTKYRGPAITMPIKEKMSDYKILGLEMPEDLVRPEYRLTLDVEEDFAVIGEIYEKLYQGRPISLIDVYNFLDDNPEIAARNSKVKIKGCEVLSANLLERPLYSIVRSGNNYVILDENKSPVHYKEFREVMDAIFFGTTKKGS